MATVTFTPLMLRGAGTRGVPLIPKSGGGGGTGLATVSNAFSMTFTPADNTVMDVGELPPYFRINPIGIAKDNPWSVSAWVSGSSGTFLGLPYASLYSTKARGFGFSYNNYLSFGGKFAGARFRETSYATSTAYDESIFNHIVITYSGTPSVNPPSSYKLYVNGSNVPISYQAPNPNDFHISSVTIGASGLPGDNAFTVWDGQVDEVGIFTASLDASTVESIYSASLPLGSGVTGDLSKLDTPPVAWYRMGD